MSRRTPRSDRLWTTDSSTASSGQALRVRPPARPPELRGQVFRARDALASGQLTRNHLESRAWRRLFRGVYADATLPDTHGTSVAGAALVVPDGAVFAGRTAAYLLGAEALVDAAAPVEVIVPEADRFGPVIGLRIRRTSLPISDVRSVGGYTCTTPLRTAVDIARHEDGPASVVALDVLLSRGLVRARDLADAAALLPPGRGSVRARRAVDLADERAESPPESVLRVLLRSAGLAPVPQYVVRDAEGRFVARVDLAFPEVRVAVEYDGAWHGRPGELSRDRRRHNALVAAGWTVVHVTAADMHTPDRVVASVTAVLCERGVVRPITPGKGRISPRSLRGEQA
jgi:very-short-patch-repair endonuclease